MAEGETSGVEGGLTYPTHFRSYKMDDRKNNIWVVVTVESGIPTDVQIFTEEKAAQEYSSMCRQHINPEDDEISLFEKQIQ
jgi:hypothetical protein